MRLTLVLRFFLLLLTILMYSANGGTLSEEVHSQKQPEGMYGMMKNRSVKEDSQKRYPALHIVQHRATIKKAKAGYGGANDLRRQRGRSSAHSLSIKHSSLFMAAFRHLIFGLLLALCFY